MTVLEIVNLGKKIPILNKSEIIKVLEVETGKGVSDAKLRRYLNKFQDKRLRKLIKPFSQEVVKQYKLIGA